MPDQSALFTPPVASDLPEGALDSATAGASALDAWARTDYGRNVLAHALVKLQRDGWLRSVAEPPVDDSCACYGGKVTPCICGTRTTIQPSEI